MNLTRRENALSLVLFNWFPGWWVSIGISQAFVTSALYWQRKTPYFFGKYCALFLEKEKTQDEWGKERNYHSILFWPSPFILDPLTSYEDYTKNNLFHCIWEIFSCLLFLNIEYNIGHILFKQCKFFSEVLLPYILKSRNMIVSQKFNISKNVRIQDFFLVSLGIKLWISFMKTSNF